MIIPDMLKNAPMFKRLDAKIKVYFLVAFSFYCFETFLSSVFTKRLSHREIFRSPHRAIIEIVTQNLKFVTLSFLICRARDPRVRALVVVVRLLCRPRLVSFTLCNFSLLVDVYHVLNQLGKLQCKLCLL